MRLLEANTLARLREEGLQEKVRKEVTTGLVLATEVLEEAKERDQPFLYHTPQSWARKWLPSKQFILARIPLNAAAMPCEPNVENLVLKKIHAREDKPIIVDYNKNQVGKSMHGYAPPVIVIDGKHRFKAAMLRGDSTIMAWVGIQAAVEIKAFSGGGGGLAPERTTPASGARLVAQGSSRQETMLQNRPGTFAEGGKLEQLDATEVEAVGTSEGASKGWDTRGRGQNKHASALRQAGFKYRGKIRGLHTYSKIERNPRYPGAGFGKNMRHDVLVHPGTGKWIHESSYNRTNMAKGRENGTGAGSLRDYLKSGKYETTRNTARKGSLWGI